MGILAIARMHLGTELPLRTFFYPVFGKNSAKPIEKSPKFCQKFCQKSGSGGDSDGKFAASSPAAPLADSREALEQPADLTFGDYRRISVSKSHDSIKVVRVPPSYTRLTGRRYEFLRVS